MIVSCLHWVGKILILATSSAPGNPLLACHLWVGNLEMLAFHGIDTCCLCMNLGELEVTRRKEGWEANSMASTLNLAKPKLLLGFGHGIKGWAIPGLHPLIWSSAGWCFEDDPNPKSYQSILVLMSDFLAIQKDGWNPWLQRLCEYRESLRLDSTFSSYIVTQPFFIQMLISLSFIIYPIPLTKIALGWNRIVFWNFPALSYISLTICAQNMYFFFF